jgi:hypothetical protein
MPSNVNRCALCPATAGNKMGLCKKHREAQCSCGKKYSREYFGDLACRPCKRRARKRAEKNSDAVSQA